MRFKLQLSDVLQALVLFCAVIGALAPIAARADDVDVAGQLNAKARNGSQPQGSTCGLPSLRGEGHLSGALDIVGVWHCMQHVVLPERYNDTNSDSRHPGHDKLNGYKLGVSVRHDHVTLSVGVKW